MQNGEVQKKIEHVVDSKWLTALSRIANVIGPIALSFIGFLIWSIWSEQKQATQNQGDELRQARSDVLTLQNGLQQAKYDIAQVQRTLGDDQKTAAETRETRRTEAVAISGRLSAIEATLNGFGKSIDNLTLRLDDLPRRGRTP